MPELTWAAILTAAGRGVRFGSPKQLVEIAGLPMVAWSLRTFGAMPEVSEIVIATEPEHLAEMEGLAAEHAPGTSACVVPGGETRQASVRNALGAVSGRCDAVFVHDGARPLVTAADIRAGMAAVAPGRGAVLAAPVVDTIKLVPRGSSTIARTLDRDELWAAQTPQFAMLVDFSEAHLKAAGEGIDLTDDVALLERLGYGVTVVPASTPNFKVTTRSDRDLAEAILRERAATP